MKLYLEGKDSLEVDANVIGSSQFSMMFKITDTAKIELHADSIMSSRVMRYGEIVGEILNMSVANKREFYLINIEFE